MFENYAGLGVCNVQCRLTYVWGSSAGLRVCNVGFRLTYVWGSGAGLRVCNVGFRLTYVWGSSAEPQYHQQKLPEKVAESICVPFCTHWGVGWILYSLFDLRPVAVSTCSFLQAPHATHDTLCTFEHTLCRLRSAIYSAQFCYSHVYEKQQHHTYPNVNRVE